MHVKLIDTYLQRRVEGRVQSHSRHDADIAAETADVGMARACEVLVMDGIIRIRFGCNTGHTHDLELGIWQCGTR